MSDQTRITNPVEIKDNSCERVAFELMELIANEEYDRGTIRDTAPREYFLKLYAQCVGTVYRRTCKPES